MSSNIDIDAVVNKLMLDLNGQIAELVEPFIQKAVQDAEDIIRKRVAQMVVAMIQSSYSVERAGNIIRIDVRLGHEADRRSSLYS